MPIYFQSFGEISLCDTCIDTFPSPISRFTMQELDAEIASVHAITSAIPSEYVLDSNFYASH